MWLLCQHVSPKMYKDMQRVSLMQPFDEAYFEEEFPKISEEFTIMSCFGMQLDEGDKFDWRSLKDYWLEIRNVVAKYMDTRDIRFVTIENQCKSIPLRRLPKITFPDRPTKPLPRQWWDEHPFREKSLENIAIDWWKMARVPPCKYEDFAGVDSTEDEITLIEDVEDDADHHLETPGNVPVSLSNGSIATGTGMSCKPHRYLRFIAIDILNIH